MRDIRVGDIVAVTAKVTGLRGDGSYNIEPVGFDFDIQRMDNPDAGDEVDFYTVDPPVIVKPTWRKGDRLQCVDSPNVLVYWEALDDGRHLVQSHHASGGFTWLEVITAELEGLVPPAN